MRKTLLALSLSLLSAPAVAQTGDSGSKPAKASAAKEKQYCIEVEPGTGSRITRLECHTKKQWEILGVDVDELIKG